MKKEIIQIKYSTERLRAIRSQMLKKGISLESELNEMIDSVYKKYVKAEVREFIEEAEEMQLKKNKNN